jgi:hypothetical protein
MNLNKMTQHRHQLQFEFQNSLKALPTMFSLPIIVIIYFIRISVC